MSKVEVGLPALCQTRTYRSARVRKALEVETAFKAAVGAVLNFPRDRRRSTTQDRDADMIVLAPFLQLLLHEPAIVSWRSCSYTYTCMQLYAYLHLCVCTCLFICFFIYERMIVVNGSL